jgi:hypothetical protein
MGFMRKALFVGTGGVSGVVVKANSKKDRSAKALEQQVRLQKEILKLEKRRSEPPAAPAYPRPDAGTVARQGIAVPTLAQRTTTPIQRTPAIEGLEPVVSLTKTCPACAEDVKGAATVCRYCAHQFTDSLTVPARPKGLLPEDVAVLLLPDEELFIWSPCLLCYQDGTLMVTSKSVMFATFPNVLAFASPINVARRVRLGAALTTGQNRPDGTICIEIAEKNLEFHGMNPEVVKEIAATVIPDFAASLFSSDQEARARLRDRHEKIVFVEPSGGHPNPGPTTRASKQSAAAFERGNDRRVLGILFPPRVSDVANTASMWRVGCIKCHEPLAFHKRPDAGVKFKCPCPGCGGISQMSVFVPDLHPVLLAQLDVKKAATAVARECGHCHERMWFSQKPQPGNTFICPGCSAQLRMTAPAV